MDSVWVTVGAWLLIVGLVVLLAASGVVLGLVWITHFWREWRDELDPFDTGD